MKYTGCIYRWRGGGFRVPHVIVFFGSASGEITIVKGQYRKEDKEKKIPETRVLSIAK